MDRGAVLDTVTRFREALEERGITISKIALFGSHATGSPRPDSDIDLVVISDDFDGKGYWERIDVLSGAVYEVFEPIEAVAVTEEEWRGEDSLIVQYAKQGELVYQK